MSLCRSAWHFRSYLKENISKLSSEQAVCGVNRSLNSALNWRGLHVPPRASVSIHERSTPKPQPRTEILGITLGRNPGQGKTFVHCPAKARATARRTGSKLQTPLVYLEYSTVPLFIYNDNASRLAHTRSPICAQTSIKGALLRRPCIPEECP